MKHLRKLPGIQTIGIIKWIIPICFLVLTYTLYCQSGIDVVK